MKLKIKVNIRHVILFWAIALVLFILFRVSREKYAQSDVVIIDGKEVIKPKISPEEEAQRKKLQAQYDKIKAEHEAVKKIMRDAEANKRDIDSKTKAAIDADLKKTAALVKKGKDDMARYERELKAKQDMSARTGQRPPPKAAHEWKG